MPAIVAAGNEVWLRLLDRNADSDSAVAAADCGGADDSRVQTTVQVQRTVQVHGPGTDACAGAAACAGTVADCAAGDGVPVAAGLPAGLGDVDAGFTAAGPIVGARVRVAVAACRRERRCRTAGGGRDGALCFRVPVDTAYESDVRAGADPDSGGRREHVHVGLAVTHVDAAGHDAGWRPLVRWRVGRDARSR